MEQKLIEHSCPFSHSSVVLSSKFSSKLGLPKQRNNVNCLILNILRDVIRDAIDKYGTTKKKQNVPLFRVAQSTSVLHTCRAVSAGRSCTGDIGHSRLPAPRQTHSDSADGASVGASKCNPYSMTTITAK